MTNINVTLSLDKEIYNDFREYCKKEGFWVSKQIEIFMRNEMLKE